MKRILTGIISAGITIGVIAAWIIWSNSSFEETFYAMESYKIEETVRVIVLADLHQRSFGPDNETLLDRVRALRPDLLLIAGDLVNKGDPDWDYAVGLCRELAEIARAHGLNVWSYTGYTWEHLLAHGTLAQRALLESLDVLVDGPFVLAERTLALPWRGSRNQRVIDVKASLERGEVVVRPD